MGKVLKKVVGVKMIDRAMRLVLECGHHAYCTDGEVSLLKPMRKRCYSCESPEYAKYEEDFEAGSAKYAAERKEEMLRTLAEISASIALYKMLEAKRKLH